MGDTTAQECPYIVVPSTRPCAVARRIQGRVSRYVGHDVYELTGQDVVDGVPVLRARFRAYCRTADALERTLASLTDGREGA